MQSDHSKQVKKEYENRNLNQQREYQKKFRKAQKSTKENELFVNEFKGFDL